MAWCRTSDKPLHIRESMLPSTLTLIGRWILYTNSSFAHPTNMPFLRFRVHADRYGRSSASWRRIPGPHSLFHGRRTEKDTQTVCPDQQDYRAAGVSSYGEIHSHITKNCLSSQNRSPILACRFCVLFWNFALYCTMLSWWLHQIKKNSALLAFCAGNSPVAGEFPAQRPVTRIFSVFFDLRLNKRLSKQSWGWWFETPSCSLWRHCNEKLLLCCIISR